MWYASLPGMEKLLVVWQVFRIPTTCWNCCQHTGDFFHFPEVVQPRTPAISMIFVSLKISSFLLGKVFGFLPFPWGWSMRRPCSCFLQKHQSAVNGRYGWDPLKWLSEATLDRTKEEKVFFFSPAIQVAKQEIPSCRGISKTESRSRE